MEGNILKELLLAAPKNVRLFRNNTGVGWVGKVVRRFSDMLVIKDPRPLEAGLCTGSSDLIGWTTKIITPDMVGKRVAIFTAVEGKTQKGRARDEQTNFINRVNESGGIAFIARDPIDFKDKFQ